MIMIVERTKYVVSIRIWDVYAGEGGEWVWKDLCTLEADEETIKVIKKGFRALGLSFAIGKVEGET